MESIVLGLNPIWLVNDATDTEVKVRPMLPCVGIGSVSISAFRGKEFPRTFLNQRSLTGASRAARNRRGTPRHAA